MRFGAAGKDKGPNPYRGFLWAAIFLGVLLAITHWARKPIEPAGPAPKDAAAKAEDEQPAGREKGRAMVGAVHEPDPTEADKKPVPAYLTAADMVEPPKKSEKLASCSAVLVLKYPCAMVSWYRSVSSASEPA